jgi:hypothetical protein
MYNGQKRGQKEITLNNRNCHFWLPFTLKWPPSRLKSHKTPLRESGNSNPIKPLMYVPVPTVMPRASKGRYKK